MANHNISSAWDALGERYSELSASMTVANDQIIELRSDSEAWNARLSMNLTETNGQVTDLENTTSVLTVRERSLTEELEASKDRIRALEVKVEFCVVKYDGKCFRVEVDYNRMNFDQARQKCDDHGAKLANIYSREHYYMLMGYLRTLIGDTAINAWLGMTYSSDTGSVTLSNNTTAPFLRWHPGYPNRALCCAMLLKVAYDDANQHLHNAEEDYKMGAAICEL